MRKLRKKLRTLTVARRARAHLTVALQQSLAYSEKVFMGIYHLHFKYISRKRGQSSVASAAYRRATRMRDERLGKNFNFLHKDEVVHSKLLIPENSPAWLKEIHALPQHVNSERLWNVVEKTEKRKDAKLCYEMDVALPNEFSLDQAINLIDEFVENAFIKRGMVADYSIHFKAGNHHAHILLSPRELTADGFGNKVDAWKQKNAIYTWREQFANCTNKHLEKHGIDYRVSHKSNVDRGIVFFPTVHEGYVKDGDNAAWNRKVREANLSMVKDNPELIVNYLSAQQNNFTLDDVSQELSKLYPSAAESVIRQNTLAALEAEEQVTALPQLEFKDLSISEIVFSEKDLAKAINLRTETTEEFTRIFQSIKNSLIHIGPGDDGRERYTSQAAYDIENALQSSADNLAAKSQHRIKFKQKFLKKYNLKPAQGKALRHILSGNDLSTIVGFAGTGKSYLMGCAREIWEKNGYRVRGIAVAGIAAEGLEADSKIPSMTIALFNLQLGKNPLTKRDVLVLDEAGMVDSETLSHIVNSVELSGAKLVMLGDGAQLAPIGAGVPFKALTERIGSAVLDEVIRQKEGWQKAATCEFANYETKSALSRYLDQDHILLTDSPQEKLLDDWQIALEKDGLAENIILALTNKEITQLNLAARARLFQTVEEVSFSSQTGNKQLALGERIIFLKNDYQLGVKNGTKGIIIDLATLSVQLDNGNIVQLSSGQHIDYGYATTVHKAQGITVNNAFVLFGSYWYKNLVYVAMTRHRYVAKGYADLGQYPSRQELLNKLSHWQIKDSIIGWPVNFAFRHGLEVKNFAERIAQSIKQAAERTFNQTGYLKERDRLGKIAQHQAELLVTRNDAKIVAKYADLNMLSGKLWAEKNLIELQSVTNARQEIAYTITENIGKYQLALEQNRVSIEKIWQDREKHLMRTELKAYLEKRGLSRDKLAAKIYAEIKKYYPIIKELAVDSKQLTTAARRHNRRVFLKNVSLAERQGFYLIEEYRAASIKAAQAWGKLATVGEPGCEHYRILAKIFSLQQCKLAYEITQNLDLHQNSLTYQQIAMEKLLQNSNKYLYRLTVQDYLQQRSIMRESLAAKIIGEIKKYYPIIKDLGVKTKELQIASDQYNRRRLLKESSPAERQSWYALEKYQLAAIKSAIAWGKLYPKNANPTVAAKDQLVAKYCSLQQAKLAYDLLPNLEQHPKALEYKKISIDRLRQHSEKHLSRLKVQAYLQQAGIRRDFLAAQIFAEIKQYYPIIKDLRVNTKELQIASDKYNRRRLLKAWSSAERQSWYLVEKYQFAAMHAKHAWGKVYPKDTKVTVTAKDWRLAKYCSLRQAKLAHDIVQDLEQHQKALEEQKIAADKLFKHSDKYLNRIKVQNYQQQTGSAKEELAMEIISDFKKYYPSIQDLSVDVRQLGIDARQHHKNLRLAGLSSDEMEKFDIVEQYYNATISAAKAWSVVFDKTKSKTNNAQQREIAIDLSNKQAALAYTIQSNLPDYTAALKMHNIVPAKAEAELAVLPSSELAANNRFLKLIKAAQNHSRNLARADSSRQYSKPSQEAQYFSIDQVLSGLKNHAKEIATGILGQPNKRSTNDTLYFGKNKGSLCVTVSGKNSGLWHDFSSGEGGNLIGLAAREYGLKFKDALKYCANQLGISPDAAAQHMQPIARSESSELRTNEPSAEQLKKTAYAQKIFANSNLAKGSLAEAYLNKRGINIEHTQDIRFAHVFEPETKKTMPALVIAGRDSNGEVQTVQVTYLNDDATKAKLQVPKRSYGRFEGATVLIQQGQGSTIAVAEGLETGLSIANTNPDLSVSISFGTVSKISVGEDKTTVIICADNDINNPGTKKGVAKAIGNFTAANKLVYIVQPEQEGSDFNDLLQQQGLDAVTDKLHTAELVTTHLSDVEKLQVYEQLKTTAHNLCCNVSKSLDEKQNFNLSHINKQRIACELESSQSISAAEKNKLRIDAKLHKERLIMATPEYKAIDEYRDVLDEYNKLLKPVPNLDGIQRINLCAKIGTKLKQSSFKISQDPVLLKEAQRQNVGIDVLKYAMQHMQRIQRERALSNEREHGIGD